MDVADVTPLLNQLEINIDSLEEALGPLLQHALSDRAAALSLLDRAKLYVLVTYAVESILFSLLRLNGVNAKEHPVFRELTRVKQYFEKIKAVESSGVKRENLSLNKEAAGRIIKHALAAYNPDRVEKLPKGEAKFQARADILAQRREVEAATATTTQANDDSSSESDVEESVSEPVGKEQVGKAPKTKRRRSGSSGELSDGSLATKKRVHRPEKAAVDSEKDGKEAKRAKKHQDGMERTRKERKKQKKKKKKIKE